MTLLILSIWVIIGIIMMWNFTTVESGNYKFIVTGETLVQTIDGDYPKNYTRFKGWFWINLRFIYKVHGFVINKYKLNPDRKPEDPKTWVSHEENFETYTLRKTVTIPVLMVGVELKDRTKVDLLGNAIIRFDDPKIFVFNLKGNYRALITIITSKVSDLVKNIEDLTEFIEKDKGEGSAFFKDLLNEPITLNPSELNQILLANTGGVMIAFNISEFSADSSMLEAANAKAIQELKAQARAIEADAEANFKSKQALAEIESLIDKLQSKGISPIEAMKIIADLKRSQAIENHQGTLVLGDTKTITSI